MFCSRCGYRIDNPAARFCDKCGAVLAQSAADGQPGIYYQPQPMAQEPEFSKGGAFAEKLKASFDEIKNLSSMTKIALAAVCAVALITAVCAIAVSTCGEENVAGNGDDSNAVTTTATREDDADFAGAQDQTKTTSGTEDTQNTDTPIFFGTTPATSHIVTYTTRPMSEFTEQAGTDSELEEKYKFEYMESDEVSGYVIRKYYGSEKDVVIPSSYRGSPVVGIGFPGFCDCDSVVTVVVPEGVVGIGEMAFSSCDRLTSIDLPDSLTETDDAVFSSCTSLKEITIPDNVTEIGQHMFEGCESLTSAVLGDGLTEIGAEAFFGCNSLASVIIGDGVKEIHDDAFTGCKSLTSVVIGDGVEVIHSYAFFECKSLASVIIGDSVKIIKNSAFDGCTALRELRIPDSVTEIQSRAFDDCNITITAPREAYYYGYTPENGVTWIVE